MDPDRYQQVSDLFLQVKDLDAECRDLALADADDSMVVDVQLLLAQHDEPSLQTPGDVLDKIEDHDDLIGERIGDYTILTQIGAGGMGRVYKAEHGLMRRMAALKVLSWVSTGRTNSSRVRRFFEREVQAIARLEHPNIVTAYDAGQTDGQYWYAMELVDGVDLSKLLKRSGPLPFAQAVECVLQAARGLGYAHKKGIIHRDIKPANLLLNSEGVLKILDMGLAKLNDVDEDEGITDSGIESAPDEATMSLTHTGQMVGSVHYMSPEHAANPRNADNRSDIYSLGVTFYRLLTGELPFKGDTSMEVLIAHREQKFPPLSELLTDVPDGLDTIVERMTARNPNNRYQSMREMIVELESLAMRCGWTMSIPDSPSFATSPLMDQVEQPRTVRVGVVAVAVLVVAAVLAVIEANRWPEMVDVPPVEVATESDGLAKAAVVTPVPDPPTPVTPTAAANPYPDWTQFGGTLRYQATDGVVVGKPRIVATHSDGRAVAAMAFSSDGKWLATAGGDKSILITEVRTGKVAHAIRNLDAPMTAVAISLNGKYVIAGDRDGKIIIWSTEDWTVVNTLTEHANTVTTLRLMGKSNILISASIDGTVRVWDYVKGTLTVSTRKVPNGFYAMDICPKKFTIIAGDKAGSLHRYATDNDKAPITASSKAIRAVAYRPGSLNYFTAGSDGLIRIWDGYDSEVSKLYGPRRSEGSIWSMAFRADGQVLATGYFNKMVRVWDLLSHKPRLVLDGHSSPVNSMAFSPNGKILAVRHGSSVCLWPIRVSPLDTAKATGR
jgi:serine/threonine protein kinase